VTPIEIIRLLLLAKNFIDWAIETAIKKVDEERREAVRAAIDSAAHAKSREEKKNAVKRLKDAFRSHRKSSGD
jgi:acyl-CoA reductase-like NAD-dependent aldehyde dehydrogenase